MKVHNISGTSKKHYKNPPNGYFSWKEYWEDYKGKNFEYCSRNICLNKAEVGGHVQKAGINDRHWYIVPLCKECNNISSNISFDVNEDDLVPVNEYWC